MTDVIRLGPLSHSSAQSLLSCEQKFYNYKVAKLSPDADYEKSDALSVGSAFHYVLEKTKHEKSALIRTLLEECTNDPDVKLDPENYNLVHAMVLKYLRLHKRMAFEVVAIEFKLETEWFTGFIDAIMVDTKGYWWIVDLKAYKSIHMPSLAALTRDPQLTLYAGHAALIAEMFKLDLGKFGGCRWRVVTKSSAAKKATEDDAAFILRLVNNNIKAYDIPVPFSRMDVDARMDLHHRLYQRTQGLARGDLKPVKNYGACMNYFSPCEYWSQCHGELNSNMQGTLEITEES
jgi:RecB family exonuclease